VVAALVVMLVTEVMAALVLVVVLPAALVVAVWGFWGRVLTEPVEAVVINRVRVVLAAAVAVVAVPSVVLLTGAAAAAAVLMVATAQEQLLAPPVVLMAVVAVAVHPPDWVLAAQEHLALFASFIRAQPAHSLQLTQVICKCQNSTYKLKITRQLTILRLKKI
jgi:hypothetical protein